MAEVDSVRPGNAANERARHGGPPVTPKPADKPRRLGDFEILRELGRGGMNGRVRLRAARPGDADVDGDVNFNDFEVLANHFGMPGGWQNGDFDSNGQVQFPDFVILANNFGHAVITAVVPEPSAVFLLTIGLLAELRPRRSLH